MLSSPWHALLTLVFVIVPAAAGLAIGRRKGRWLWAAGLAAGLVASWIGVAAIALVPARGRVAQRPE